MAYQLIVALIAALNLIFGIALLGNAIKLALD